MTTIDAEVREVKVKDSGWGRFGGQAVVDEFTELRWITVQGGSGHPFPF